MQANKVRGFSLLEAIVALALLASLGLTLFAWLNTNLASVSRLRDHDAQTRLRFLAVEWALSLNPAVRSRGEAPLDASTHIRWEATPSTPMIPGAPFPGGTQTPFQLARYKVQVWITRKGLSEPVEVTVMRVGHLRQQVVPETP